jgi:CheY-like chemotaxis protein
MPRILIADDDSDLRALMACVIGEHGYDVETASDGAHLVQMLDTAAEMPSAVVLDLIMPRVGGLDALRAIRKIGPTKRLPAIVVSGSPIDDAELEGLDVSAFLLKPFAASALLVAIDRACGRAVSTLPSH